MWLAATIVPPAALRAPRQWDLGNNRASITTARGAALNRHSALLAELLAGSPQRVNQVDALSSRALHTPSPFTVAIFPGTGSSAMSPLALPLITEASVSSDHSSRSLPLTAGFPSRPRGVPASPPLSALRDPNANDTNNDPHELIAPSAIPIPAIPRRSGPISSRPAKAPRLSVLATTRASRGGPSRRLTTLPGSRRPESMPTGFTRTAECLADRALGVGRAVCAPPDGRDLSN